MKWDYASARLHHGVLHMCETYMGKALARVRCHSLLQIWLSHAYALRAGQSASSSYCESIGWAQQRLLRSLTEAPQYKTTSIKKQRILFSMFGGE
jgi:hypothetical protein